MGKNMEEVKSVLAPPIGLEPEKNFAVLANAKRLQEIVDAVKRYSKAGKSVPIEWVNELERRINYSYTPTLRGADRRPAGAQSSTAI